MIKKVGITLLFILICAGASLVLMNLFNETTEKIKGFYHIEDPDKEWILNTDPWSGGWGDRRLDEPIIVDEYLPWFVDPFSGEDGDGKGLLDVAKKYGIFVVLTIGSLFWYLRQKKKRKQKKEDPTETSVNQHTVYPGQLECTEETSITLSDEKLNEIRQMLKEWESHMNTLNRKRTHETIQEWFKRINGPTEIIQVYEKVRYGGKPFNHKELHLFKKLLK